MKLVSNNNSLQYTRTSAYCIRSKTRVRTHSNVLHVAYY